MRKGYPRYGGACSAAGVGDVSFWVEGTGHAARVGMCDESSEEDGACSGTCTGICLPSEAMICYEVCAGMSVTMLRGGTAPQGARDGTVTKTDQEEKTCAAVGIRKHEVNIGHFEADPCIESKALTRGVDGSPMATGTGRAESAPRGDEFWVGLWNKAAQVLTECKWWDPGVLLMLLAMTGAAKHGRLNQTAWQTQNMAAQQQWLTDETRSGNRGSRSGDWSRGGRDGRRGRGGYRGRGREDEDRSDQDRWQAL